MTETCNGWRNVETWRTALHFSNDEHEARAVGATATGYATGIYPVRVGVSFEDEHGTRRDGGPFKGTFAEYLRDRVERSVDRVYATPDDSSTPRPTWEMFSRDVVEAALQRVDWEQLAERFLESAKEKLPGGST